MGKKFSKKKYIISKEKEISLILETGERWKNERVAFIYNKSIKNHDRFAVLLSKEHGNSVQRNRLKRKYREQIRLKKADIPPFLDFLIQPRRKCSYSTKEIKETILKWIEFLKTSSD